MQLGDFKIGTRVKAFTGTLGTVIAVSNYCISVKFDNAVSEFDIRKLYNELDFVTIIEDKKDGEPKIQSGDESIGQGDRPVVRRRRGRPKVVSSVSTNES